MSVHNHGVGIRVQRRMRGKGRERNGDQMSHTAETRCRQSGEKQGEKSATGRKLMSGAILIFPPSQAIHLPLMIPFPGEIY